MTKKQFIINIKNKIFITKFYIIVIGFILLTCTKGFCSAINLYPINDKTGGGYIDKSGKIVIEQKYKFANRFEGNYAIVQSMNSKYGIIDKSGKMAVEFNYDELDYLSEGFVGYKKGDKWGFIDVVKNKIYEAKYDEIKKFKEGLSAVKLNNKWGFIDKSGKIVIEPEYFNVSNFSEGLSAVSTERFGTIGYIDKKGKIKISFKENNLAPREFKEGLAPVIFGEDKACSYINKKGKIVIDGKKIYPINAYCGDFFEGYTVFYIDNDPKNIITGFIDKNGKIRYSMLFSIPNNVSEGEFSAFDEFSSGMAQFRLDYKTGYLNKKFQLVIPPIYEFARDFIGDLAYVKFENKEGYINKVGKWVWQKEREGM